MKAGRSCWTCKDRKVACDQGLPACEKCIRGGRKCQGYQSRLFWPKKNDPKRAITYDHSTDAGAVVVQMRRTGPHLFVNATYRDLEFHRRTPLPFEGSPHWPVNTHQSGPKLWKQPQTRIGNMELVFYFQEVAYLALITFSDYSGGIRDVVMEMILTNDTMPAQALMSALLAFSSLHRYGLKPEAMRFKVAALQALSASAEGADQGPTQASQHVATCMLLCAFEILLPSESSGDWLWYIKGALEIAQSAKLSEVSGSSYINDLLEWVYYHDTVSRFATSHWTNKSVALDSEDTTYADLRGNRFLPLPKTDSYTPISSNPTNAVLEVLKDVCETVIDPSDPRSHEEAYQKRLKALEWRVDNLPSLPPVSDNSPQINSPPPDMSLAASLYQVATMIYLVRATQSPWGPSTNLHYLVDRVLAPGMHEPVCRHVFPLFILACEARTEEHRASVLDLLERTESNDRMRYLDNIRAQIHAFWIQQDLHADGELLLNYQGLMKAVISSNNALPSFA